MPAGLFRLNVDEGPRLLTRILRLSTFTGPRPSANGAPFRLRALFLIERLALPGQRSAKRRAQFAPVEVLVDLDQPDRACGLRRFALELVRATYRWRRRPPLKIDMPVDEPLGPVRERRIGVMDPIDDLVGNVL